MSAIASQTAGPNWLNFFFEGTQGNPGGNIGLKTIFFKMDIFKKNNNFTGNAGHFS